MISRAIRRPRLPASWCWGATGQLLARLHCGSTSERTSKLAGIVSTSWQTQVGLCHGASGAQSVLRSAAFRKQFSSYPVDLNSIPKWSFVSNSRVAAPQFAVDTSLFTGYAGLLLHLSSIRDARYLISDGPELSSMLITILATGMAFYLWVVVLAIALRAVIHFFWPSFTRSWYRTALNFVPSWRLFGQAGATFDLYGVIELRRPDGLSDFCSDYS
ncbi:lanthionine synthetase LanC family protein [Rathayibacter toxicus]|uniref:lanthionine synthetase LanC family protein n=1 Tax=Rathayibacter toxicus TaxID=145458 RepID=UPI00344D7448